jgi:hypothetical protein
MHKLLSKIKSLKYLIQNDKDRTLLKSFLKKPVQNSFNIITSLLKQRTYEKRENLFLFGFREIKDFKKTLKEQNNIFLGFSYCQKPLQCPQQRFSNKCFFDDLNQTCQKCFIGTCKGNNIIPFIITDTFSLGKKVFEISKNPKPLFIITACEFSIKMFSFCSSLLKIKGIGIPLNGPTCPNFKAFEKAEKGLKKNVTILQEEHQKLIIDLLSK